MKVDKRRHTRGFTLIELLVVIALIALMVGILLPALAAARDSARSSKCLVNLRSIAQAVASYETDQRRMPTHVREWHLNGQPSPNFSGSPAMFPASVRFSNAAADRDLSTLYAPYMDIEFFVCPHVPKWSITDELNRSGSSTTNSDYYFTPGYYGNGNGATMTSYWTRSDTPWTYDNRRMSVVAGDKAYFFDTYIVVNHTQNLPGAYQWRPGTFGGFAYRVDTNDDTIRYRSPTNHSFTDGSARTVAGADKLIPVNGLWSARPNANYLMPFD